MARASRPTVLIADDDSGILSVVSRTLQLSGFLVFSCGDGDRAISLLEEVEPCLVVLDVRMPQMDGITACRRIRRTSDVPIIMLTVIDDQKGAAAAIQAGADDYIRKPFGVDELVARVHAVLRRSRVGVLPSEVLQFGPIVLDGAKHLARLSDTDLPLTAIEFAVLAHLIRHRDRVLTHGQILEAVWGREYIDSRHMLRGTMSRLRKKLNRSGRELIETLPRVGYRLRVDKKAT